MRKFECKNCGKSFSIDEKGQVKCPHCGSDNVDYASIHIPYKYIGTFIFVVLAIFLLTRIDYSSLFKHSEDVTEAEHSDPTTGFESGGEENEVSQEELNKELKELGVAIKPTIGGVSDMKVDDDGNYNYIIKINHAPKEGFYVVISDIKTNEVVAKSKDGTFKGVPFSKNEGKYLAQIVDASSNEALSEPTVIIGFVEVKSISKKLSAKELQDLINKQDPSLHGHDNEYLSPVYKIKYENLPKGSEKPDNLSDVIEMLNMEVWTSIEVTSVEYDDTKHISSITLKVKAPSRPVFVDEDNN